MTVSVEVSVNVEYGRKAWSPMSIVLKNRHVAIDNSLSKVGSD
jgi:hypothetical protein